MYQFYDFADSDLPAIYTILQGIFSPTNESHWNYSVVNQCPQGADDYKIPQNLSRQNVLISEDKSYGLSRWDQGICVDHQLGFFIRSKMLLGDAHHLPWQPTRLSISRDKIVYTVTFCLDKARFTQWPPISGGDSFVVQSIGQWGALVVTDVIYTLARVK